MLIFILPAAACRLTSNKLPDEATLSPAQEQSQAVNTPQTHMLNEESVGSKGEMENNGGGYDIPTIVGSRLNFVELGIFTRWHTSYGHTLYARQNAWFECCWETGHK
jgi:hypothetical protein